MGWAMMRAAALGTALCSAGAALAQVEPTATVELPAIGCLDQEDTLRAARLLAAGDQEAVVKFYFLKKEQCKIYPKGQKVSIEKEDVRRFRMSCGRVKGDPFCYWLPTDLLIK